MIGSFLSGSFIGLMAVKAFAAMGPSLAMFADPKNAMNIVRAFAGFRIALAASFVVTLLLHKDEVTAEASASEPVPSAQPSAAEDDTVKPGSLVSPSWVPWCCWRT